VVIHSPYSSNADGQRRQHAGAVGRPDILVCRIYKDRVAPFRHDQSEVILGWVPRTSFYLLVNQLIICSARPQSFWTACESIQRVHSPSAEPCHMFRCSGGEGTSQTGQACELLQEMALVPSFEVASAVMWSLRF
jgi:hypothetical protein